ncbi:MAG: 2-keto-4-pentenoate hydratase [Pseudomonadota bacterium]
MTLSTSDDPLAAMLANAYRNNTIVAVPAGLEPPGLAGAYQVQQRMLADCGMAAGGWKIGARSATAPIRGAPLPQTGIHRGGAEVDRNAFPVLGLELEICFWLGCDIAPRAKPYSDDEILDSLEYVGAAIEIVSSRIAGWPDSAAPLLQLADLQNHGALVTGTPHPYPPHTDWLAPQAELSLDGEILFRGAGRNPAGDPRRLLFWLVQHCSEQGLLLPRGSVITTGSYTGMQFPAGTGTVRGVIDGLPPVEFSLCRAASTLIF